MTDQVIESQDEILLFDWILAIFRRFYIVFAIVFVVAFNYWLHYNRPPEVEYVSRAVIKYKLGKFQDEINKTKIDTIIWFNSDSLREKTIEKYGLLPVLLAGSGENSMSDGIARMKDILSIREDPNIPGILIITAKSPYSAVPILLIDSHLKTLLKYITAVNRNSQTVTVVDKPKILSKVIKNHSIKTKLFQFIIISFMLGCIIAIFVDYVIKKKNNKLDT